MPIPESQLETWSKQGATTTAITTHTSIRLALTDDRSPLTRKGLREGTDFEIYLQGSYRNTTNIRGDSDVDVVIQLNSSFLANTSNLSFTETIRYSNSFGCTYYGWDEFRADVLEALQTYYGRQNIDDTGNKSIKLKKTPGRLAADIVPCLEYRQYTSFSSLDNQSFVEGMIFYTKQERREVINYPKQHYKNGAAKNSVDRTQSSYKPSIRMFKNAKYYLINNGIIARSLAPSYFLEGLLYNVSDGAFEDSYQMAYLKILVELSEASLASFTCQNEQLPLFGNLPEQWLITDARELLSHLLELWQNW